MDCESLAIAFRDKARTIAGAEVWVIPNMLLQCSREPSSHEVIKTVERLVEEAAELGDGNVAEAVSYAKTCMAHSAEIDETVSPGQVGRQVFEDDQRLMEHFEEAIGQAGLPEEVHIRHVAARRLTKTHRIRTDTGIDIAFPSEFSTSPEHLLFQREEDGTISILIRNVKSIENR